MLEQDNIIQICFKDIQIVSHYNTHPDSYNKLINKIYLKVLIKKLINKINKIYKVKNMN